MTAKQKGFESPLKKAQAGKIGGGGRVSEVVERYDTQTQEHNDVSTVKHTDDTDESREPMFRQTVYMPKKPAPMAKPSAISRRRSRTWR